MDYSYLHTMSYWFGTNTDLKGKFFTLYLVLFSIFFIIGIGIILLAKGEWRKVWMKFAIPFLVTSVLGWIYLGAQYELLPWLSIRLLLLLIILMFCVWMIALFVWSAVNMPKITKEKKVEENYKRYLPKTGQKLKVRSKK